MTNNKFETLNEEQKYEYIINKRKEWKDYKLFKEDNIPLLKIVLRDIHRLICSELHTLSKLAIHSNNELLECFDAYKKLSYKDKYSKSKLYFKTVYGSECWEHYYNLYRQNNANAVREGTSKRTDFRESSSFCVEYWIKQGYSVHEAKTKISNVQKLNSDKYHNKMKSNNLPYCNGKQIQYYLNKGYSLEISKKLLKDSQSTFSLEKCIMKYGEVDGLEVFKNRQIKWQNTLNSLPIEIKNKILQSKSVSWGKASKESLNYFIPLYKKLRKLGISRDDIYLGVTGSKEYRLKGDYGIRLYDFCILSHKILIEYHSIAWHSKTEDDSKQRLNPKGGSLIHSWENDCYKKELAKNNGFDIIELWSDEILINDDKINKLLEKIKGDT